MASAQQLGAQLYNPFLPPDANAKLQGIQQQQALAQTLLSQGTDPISTQGRQIGGVGYNISPWEGVAKLGQILSGKEQQQDANQQTADLVTGANGGSGSGADPYVAMGLPPQVAQLVRYYSMNGEARAAAELISKFAGPTDLQKNLQIPAGDGSPAPIGGAPTSAPSTQPAPPIPAPPPPQTGGASGSWGNDPAGGINIPAPAPPEGAQAPIGAAAPIPPVNGSSLVGGALPNAAPVAPRLTGNALQQQAQIDAQKAGASKQAEVQGQNIADAQKGMSSIDSRIGNAKAIIQEMKDLSPNVPYGPHGLAEMQVDASNMPVIGNGKAAGAAARFNTLNQNLFTQELPAIVQSSGGRIDIPLVNAIKGASSVDLDLHPNAKIQALNTLAEQLDRVQQNAKLNYQNLSGKAPAQSQTQQPTINWSFQNGKLVRQ